MKTDWNNKQGSRDRQALAVLVTVDGNVHQFRGESIPLVCQSTRTGWKKDGKWSYSTYSVLHHDTTAFVSWHEDWDTGTAFPQESWESGRLWLAQKAPAVKSAAFEKFVRENFPKTAALWDERAKAEAEFSAPATAEQLAALVEAKAEVERQTKALAEKQAAQSEARRLAQELAETQAEAKRLAEHNARFNGGAFANSPFAGLSL